MQESENISPDWINIEFLQKAIRSYKDDDSVEIQNFKIKSGFADHIASTMFQCKIDFNRLNCERETLNVVIKANPVNVGLESIVTNGPLFENEIRMYKSTIPAIHQLYDRIGLNINFAPELIYATDSPFPIIFLKDLTTDGFFAPNFPLDEMEHSKLLVQRLAQFHAASYYLSEMKELDLTNYNYSVYDNELLINTLYKETVKTFQEVLETWEGYQDYIPKLEQFMKDVGEIGRKCQTANKPHEGYNVLNHGDLHIRNTLVKFNSEKNLENFYFIDYQLSVYGSPAIDLNYVINLLKRDKNGETAYEDVIVFYHQEFVEALKSFGFSRPIPSLIDLNIELLRHGRTNVLMTIAFTPFLLINLESVKVEDMFGSTENNRNNRKMLYNQSTCKSVMQNLLKSFVHKGWL